MVFAQCKPSFLALTHEELCDSHPPINKWDSETLTVEAHSEAQNEPSTGSNVHHIIVLHSLIYIVQLEMLSSAGNRSQSRDS